MKSKCGSESSLFSRNELDDNNPKKFGLKGWVTLKESYGLPKSYIPKITNFHETFLKSEYLNRPENTSMVEESGEFDMFEECITNWTNVDSTEQNNQLCAEIILKSAPLCEEFSYSNLVILADRRADAMEIRKILHKKNTFKNYWKNILLVCRKHCEYVMQRV